MGFIDWIILAVLILFTFFGWRKGLLASLVQLGGYILTFFLVGHYYPLVQRNLMQKFHFAKWLATVVSVVLIIVLIVVIVRLVIYILERFLRALKLSAVNHTLGAVLGIINGLLVVIILTVVLDFMPKLSTPLKNGEKHRVYAGVDLVKEEIFTKLKLTERTKLIKMPKLPFAEKLNGEKVKSEK
jgi:membrane protein required for colicin V production